MPPSRARVAIIGTGFMGRVHCEALRRLGVVDVAAVAGSHIDKAAATAGPLRAMGDIGSHWCDMLEHVSGERPDELWIGHRNGRNEILMKDPALLDARVEPEYPEFADGLRQMRLLDAVLASHERRVWVDVQG